MTREETDVLAKELVALMIDSARHSMQGEVVKKASLEARARAFIRKLQEPDLS